MLSAIPRVNLARTAPSYARLFVLGTLVLVAALMAVYMTLLSLGAGIGVDFACFRAASLLLAHGANPYDNAQMWRMENLLYNVPRHLQPGSPNSYMLIRYFNPPLFASLLTPLAGLPFALGYPIFAGIVLALAGLGAWLTLQALGWRSRVVPAVAIVLVAPSVFISAWYGQQSTLLLCALGGALYALSRSRPELAGALLAIGWVKPHLLIPVALAMPLALPAVRATLRWYAGFGTATALGGVAMLLISGPGSVLAWLQTLFGHTGSLYAAQNYLPSLSGMSWILLPHPWGGFVVAALTLTGIGVMATLVGRGRRGTLTPCETLCVLAATWLLFTPFAHAHDEVLILPALALAWGRSGAWSLRALPLLALWALLAFSMAFLLPEPWKLLGLAPPILVFAAALRALPAAPVGQVGE